MKIRFIQDHQIIIIELLMSICSPKNVPWFHQCQFRLPTPKTAPIPEWPFRPNSRPVVIFQPPPTPTSAAGSHPHHRLPERANPAFHPNVGRYTATRPGQAGKPRLHGSDARLGVPPAIDLSTAGERNSQYGRPARG